MACEGLPHLCCNCRTCTHRKMSSGFSQVWSSNVRIDKYGIPYCRARVIDMQVRGDLYILWMNMDSGSLHVSKETTAGDKLWTITVEPDLPTTYFVPRRIDSDGTLVWVCGFLPFLESQKGLFAYSADDGTLLWTKSGGHFDVDPDGAGGCYAVKWGVTGCDVRDDDFGTVVQYDSNGDPVISFGHHIHPMSVHVAGGRVWVGGEFATTSCFCGSLDAPAIGGTVYAYSLEGDLELVCAGGEWLDNPKAQSPLFQSPGDEYVNFIVSLDDGTIVAGTVAGGLGTGTSLADTGCSFFYINGTTGSLESTIRLTELLRGYPYVVNNVIKMAVAGGTLYAVVSDGVAPGGTYLISVGGIIKQHNGYLRDLSTAYMDSGTYATVTSDGTDLFIGGEEAGCVLYDDTIEGSPTEECGRSQSCECGDFNTRGQAVVDCGCEDGVDPTCAAYLNVSFTGCLAAMQPVINLRYVDPSLGGTCHNCPDGGHAWTGNIDGFNSFPDDEDCFLVISGTVSVCFDCESGWIVKFCLSGGGASAVFFATIESSTCGPPSFTFTFDGTFEELTGILTDCCDGTTGCGGFIGSQGCGIIICCDDPFPQSLTATFSAPGCPYHGLALPISYMGELAPDIHYWEGTLDIDGCGACTFRFQINNNIACEWSMGIRQDSGGTEIWGCFYVECDQGSISCPFVSASYSAPNPICAGSMTCVGSLTIVVA